MWSLWSLVGRILAVAMEIWNHECGPFWPNFAIFAIVYPQEWSAVYGLSFTLGRAYECINTWCHVTGALVVQFVLILYCKLFFAGAGWP